MADRKTSVDPTSVDPTSVDPTSGDATSVDPTSVDPTSGDATFDDATAGDDAGDSGAPSGDAVTSGTTAAARPAKPSLFAENPIGAEALKAFAHPLRMAMYDALSEHGPATASQLGRMLGESSGQTSYHLRQLEKHGFIEDDPDHPGGRERWWRPIGFSIDGRQMLADPALAPAARAMLQGIVAERAEVLTRWMSDPHRDPEWSDSEINNRITTDLTPQEAHDLIDAVQRVMEEHLDAAKARKDAGETAGRRRVRIYLDALPLPLDDDETA